MARGRPSKHQEGDLCETCFVTPKRFKGYSPSGRKIYGATCQACHRNMHSRHRKDHCELCDYKPLFMRTLDVHHRDGDNSNNDESNLLTVCANCHRELEATIHELGDWEKAESWLKKFLKRLVR
jgi:hypothetical protein